MLVYNLKIKNFGVRQVPLTEVPCANYLHAVTVIKRTIAKFVRNLPKERWEHAATLQSVWETEDPVKLIHVWNSFRRGIEFELELLDSSPKPDYEVIPFPVPEEE